jgi:hypothetical protein
MYTVINRIFVIGMIFLFSNVINARNIDTNAIKNSYNQWCLSISLARGNPEKVVQFYAKNAVLLPTLSNKILFNDHGGLNAYFANLTSYKNIHCLTKKLIIERNGADFATTAGFYQFIYTDQKGKKVIIPARFTFVYERFNNEWLIIQHHSSKLPFNN